MTILVLPSARDDLAEGFDFYERQEPGVGEYFWNPCSRILNRCGFTREFMPNDLASIVCCPSGSPTPFFTTKAATPFGCGLYWTVGGSRRQSVGGLQGFASHKLPVVRLVFIGAPPPRPY